MQVNSGVEPTLDFSSFKVVLTTQESYVESVHPYMDVDWILVRKYASPEPSIASIGEEQLITKTDSQGNYSYVFKAPLEAGTYEIKVNLTDPNGIYGENSTTFIQQRIAIRDQKQPSSSQEPT